jgi:cyclophilin family peptidyl-prolyl cis-trans isomerase
VPDTSKGVVDIEVTRLAAARRDRFVNLVRYGYYDDARFFRVTAGRWTHSGIAGDQVAQAWRNKTLPDDPFKQSNVRHRRVRVCRAQRTHDADLLQHARQLSHP